jgi:hypothetical protein
VSHAEQARQLGKGEPEARHLGKLAADAAEQPIAQLIVTTIWGEQRLPEREAGDQPLLAA